MTKDYSLYICGLVEQLWNAFELLGDLAQRPGSSSRAPWSGVEEERDDPGLGVGDVQRELGAQFNRKIWLEFRLEKQLEFWLPIPYTKKTFKNG